MGNKKRIGRVWSDEAIKIANEVMPASLFKEIKHFDRVQMGLYIYELRKQAFELGAKSMELEK